MDNNSIVLGVKCAPEKNIFSDICSAGIEAVELYLTKDILTDISRIIKLCNNFSLRYALHVPNDGYGLDEVAAITKEISVEVVVFHNIYWENEWDAIIKRFKGSTARLCVENTHSVHEPVKFMRRYGIGNCLDLEHAQMQCAGLYEEEFINAMGKASHIHMTGYKYGSNLWHTHLHHSPEHSMYLLDLLEKARYSGLVISEAKVSLQLYAEFKKLQEFYEYWRRNRSKRTHSYADKSRH